MKLTSAFAFGASYSTWSHPQLTTLTNEQIVAELGWTRKIIKDVIGVTTLTFRPPRESFSPP
jgi:peptidoglycan/xylan/chitin deacetylase (PgdA/CDA1 family)